jgi:hypothetical protein
MAGALALQELLLWLLTLTLVCISLYSDLCSAVVQLTLVWLPAYAFMQVCTVLKAVLMLHLASTLDLVVFANAFLHKLTK